MSDVFSRRGAAVPFRATAEAPVRPPPPPPPPSVPAAAPARPAPPTRPAPSPSSALPPPRAAAAGWHESSLDLRLGLVVVEHESLADALAALQPRPASAVVGTAATVDPRDGC